MAAEFKQVFALNEALSMQMIGARENGTRHHETRAVPFHISSLSLSLFLSFVLILSTPLSPYLLYEPRTEDDDGNDAW